MILRQLRIDKKRVVELHRGVTVVGGLAERRRGALAAALAAEVAEGLVEEGAPVLDVIVHTGDLPPAPRPEPVDDVIDRAARAVDDAVAEERRTWEEVEAAQRDLDAEAAGALAAAGAAVAEAESRVERVRARLRALEEARGQAEREQDEAAKRRAGLEVRRDEAAAAVAEARKSDPEAVREALAAYRRLQSVKPRPSARATALADRWVAYRARHRGELPEVEPPPEYLVAPAQAALDAARAALAEAEKAGEVAVEIDLDAVEELERAHRKLLEAEQRANLRSSRLNRRRLDAAQDAERQALIRLGVADYGDYLRRIVPVVRAGGATRTLEAAREALADAEAVWEELHGGVPPMSDDDLAAMLAAIREEALELLGRDPGDDAIEEALRSQTESVVDVAWAREELGRALADVGVEPGQNAEAAADDWLSGAAERRRRLQEAEAALAAVEEELAALATGDAAPAVTEDAAPDAEGDRDDSANTDEAKAAQDRLDGAERALTEAQAAQRLAAERASRAAAAEQRVQEARARHEAAASARAAAQAQARPATAVDVTMGTVGPEMVLYMLARLAAHRSAPLAGVLPLVVDDAFTALPADARSPLLDLLTRVATTMQVIYLTGSDEIQRWGDGLAPEVGAAHRP